PLLAALVIPEDTREVPQREVSFLSTLTGKPLFKLAETTDGLTAAFSPDGKFLVTGGPRALRFWDTATGKEFPLGQGHFGEVHSLAFTADGKQLFSAGDDGVLTWDLATRTINRSGGQINREKTQCLALAPDGKQLLVASQQRARFWNLSPAKPLG